MSGIIVRAAIVDGQVVEIAGDGARKPMASPPPLRDMTEEEILTAALSDPDCPPLTEADLKRMKRRPRATVIRRALGLTQEEFSLRYGIPLGTLRDWEQGRSEPDATAKAYLRVIAAEPETVAGALMKPAAA
jgi:putative transcriptional regulator